jgi:hypothetical protein
VILLWEVLQLWRDDRVRCPEQRNQRPGRVQAALLRGADNGGEDLLHGGPACASGPPEPRGKPAHGKRHSFQMTSEHVVELDCALIAARVHRNTTS